jgi:hypothetical protein
VTRSGTKDLGASQLAITGNLLQADSILSLGIPDREEVAGFEVRHRTVDLRPLAVQTDQFEGVHMSLKDSTDREISASYQAQQVEESSGSVAIGTKTQPTVSLWNDGR